MIDDLVDKLISLNTIVEKFDIGTLSILLNNVCISQNENHVYDVVAYGTDGIYIRLTVFKDMIKTNEELIDPFHGSTNAAIDLISYINSTDDTSDIQSKLVEFVNKVIDKVKLQLNELSNILNEAYLIEE
jgi:hypothetical protein